MNYHILIETDGRVVQLAKPRIDRLDVIIHSLTPLSFPRSRP